MTKLICYRCRNKGEKEKMICLEVDHPTNPNKPKKKGYRYFHPECYKEKSTKK